MTKVFLALTKRIAGNFYLKVRHSKLIDYKLVKPLADFNYDQL